MPGDIYTSLPTDLTLCERFSVSTQIDGANYPSEGSVSLTVGLGVTNFSLTLPFAVAAALRRVLAVPPWLLPSSG